LAQGLQDREGSFRIVFFDAHRALWDRDWSKLLARELIIRHLTEQTSLAVDIFETWHETDNGAVLSLSSVFFAGTMTHI
jgi:hypothetical protein